MISGTGLSRAAGRLAHRLGGDRGIVVVVVMVFCFVFLVLGLALYWLSAGQIRATETERKDVKAFNVAEAGVDAGMLALKLEWPFSNGDSVTVDQDLVKAALQDENATLYDPDRSEASEFLQVTVYDNSVYDDATGEYVRVTEPPAEEDRVYWDAMVSEDYVINGGTGYADGQMFVDATSNVQDDRHRILLLAERQVWNLYFPVTMALHANEVDSNGSGYGIEIEVGTPPIYYDVDDVQGKGINEGLGVDPAPETQEFDEVVTEAIIRALKGIALQKGTYFTTSAAAQTFLLSANAPGSVVYLESTTDVEISGSNQMGSEDYPIVCIIDCREAPPGTDVAWDMRGTADFFGILVVLGDTELRGTCSVHGALYTSGTMLNKGTGAVPELFYNQTAITNINRQYVLSVNIVANTWEEYAVPKAD